tara:strand:+ start:881 stop:1666 length:786 start_codon:yes stop_codon:yes gene_type:complete
MNNRLIRVASLIFLIFLAFYQAAYADVRYVFNKHLNEGSKITEWTHIEILGEIKDQDTEKLKNLLLFMRVNHDEYESIPVFLNSQGGSVEAALKMGRMLREYNATTAVIHGKQCSSACLFVLAGGVNRLVLFDAVLGLHRPKFNEQKFAELDSNQARQVYNSLLLELRAYLREMGILTQLLDDMLLTGSHSMDYRNRTYGEAVKLAGVDPAYKEWMRARTLQSLGPEVLEARDRYTDCINARKPRAFCDRIYHAELNRLQQ